MCCPAKKVVNMQKNRLLGGIAAILFNLSNLLFYVTKHPHRKLYYGQRIRIKPFNT
jgi:hypothetical protein